MHIAEGVLPLSQCLGWFAASAPFVAAGVLRTLEARKQQSGEARGLLSMAGALTMAVTVLPVPIPGLGVTSHMCATPVLALLLGPRLLVIPTALVLLIQALFLAHGGVTTLGANVITLGVVGPLVGVALARILRVMRVPGLAAVGLACGLADVLVYVVDAAIVAVGLQGEHSFLYWFGTILLAFAPAQLPLALLEGALSVGLVRALAARRPDLVPGWLGVAPKSSTKVLATAAAAGVVLVLLMGIPRAARAEGWKGLDDMIREKAKAATGREGNSSLVADGGEVFELCLATTFFVAGFVLGRGWNSLGKREAPRVPGS